MRYIKCIEIEEIIDNADEIANFISFELDGVYHKFRPDNGDFSECTFECETLIDEDVEYHSPASITLHNGNILKKPDNYYTSGDKNISYCLCFHEEGQGRWAGYNSYGKLLKDCNCLKCHPEQIINLATND